MNEVPDIVDDLRVAMRRRGLSISELAKRAGLHKSTIYFWFDGGRSPNLKSLVKAAEVLGMSVELTRQGPRLRPTVVVGALLAPPPQRRLPRFAQWRLLH